MTIMKIKSSFLLAFIILSMAVAASTQDNNVDKVRDLLGKAYELYNKDKNYAEAISITKEAIDLMPSCRDGKCDELPCNCAQAWYLMGLCYADPKWDPNESKILYHDKAIECYEKALTANPRYKEALSEMGYSLAASGRYREALQYVNKSLELDPNFDDAWDNKGYIFYKMGTFYYKQALECWDKAIESNAQWGDPYSNEAAIYEEPTPLKNIRLSEEFKKLAANGTIREYPIAFE